MKTLFYVCFSCVVTVCVLCTLPVAAAAADPTVQLLNSDSGLRDKAVQSILQDRQQLIQALIAVASQQLDGYHTDFQTFIKIANEKGAKVPPELSKDMEYREDVAAGTIRLLGRLRAAEAIPLLVKNLNFNTGNYHSNRDGFPCLGALIEIGSAAFGPLLTEVASTDDPDAQEIRFLIALAFINIVRRDAALAYIKSQAPPDLSAVQKGRLEALSEKIKSLPDAFTN